MTGVTFTSSTRFRHSRSRPYTFSCNGSSYLTHTGHLTYITNRVLPLRRDGPGSCTIRFIGTFLATFSALRRCAALRKRIAWRRGFLRGGKTLLRYQGPYASTVYFPRKAEEKTHYKKLDWLFHSKV